MSSYVLHQASVGCRRAAEVGDLEADVQVCRSVGDCDMSVSLLYGWTPQIKGPLTWDGSVSDLDFHNVSGECRRRDQGCRKGENTCQQGRLHFGGEQRSFEEVMNVLFE